MRKALAAVLLAALSVASPVSPVSAAPTSGEPYNCPPACDGIPASAWIDSWAIPLNARYGWPTLSTVAAPVQAPRFRFEDICGTPTVADPRAYAVAARAVVPAPPGQWQLQAQVVHWRGETWRGADLVRDTFAAAASALRACQRTNPSASPSVTVDEPDRLAAVISGPVIVREYLVANPVNSTITELALYATAPPTTPWPAVADAGVLDALAAPLCTAYIGSCP